MKLKTNLLLISFSLLAFVSGTFAQNTVEGYLLYHNNPSKPIPSSQVTMTTMSGEVIATVNTDNAGKYTFLNIPDGTYELNASTTLSAGGVTLTDSYLVLLHLLGFTNLSPIQQVAADVTGDGLVGWDDYTTIVIGWFLNGYPFPAGDWFFTSATVTTGLKDNTNMGGTSAADVNGTYVPNLTIGNHASVFMDVNGANSDDNQNIILAKDNSITGFVLVFDLDEQTSILSLESQLPGCQYTIKDQQLRITWMAEDAKPVNLIAGSVIFTLSGNNILLTPAIESHFISSNGEVVENVTLKTSAATTVSEIEMNHQIYLQGNTLHVSIVSEAQQHAVLDIFDLSGRLVASQEFSVNPGSNTYNRIIDLRNNESVVTYRLRLATTPELSTTGKLFIGR